jgi:hypothetical protein
MAAFLESGLGSAYGRRGVAHFGSACAHTVRDAGPSLEATFITAGREAAGRDPDPDATLTRTARDCP